MCELFGISSIRKIKANGYLRTFFSHSEKHCCGWGMASFCGQNISLEKEPLCASQSQYLKFRMASPILADNMIAHIRLASIGCMKYENSHPFILNDNAARMWTLAHNGTIFAFPHLQDFCDMQCGETDSERILLYLVDEVNRRQTELERPLTKEERQELMDRLIADLSVHNKLNLLIWDGEQMYVHTNYADTLHMLQVSDGTVVFSTLPLDDGPWQKVPFLQLQVYDNGRLIFQGRHRSTEYIDPEKDFEYKSYYYDYAGL